MTSETRIKVADFIGPIHRPRKPPKLRIVWPKKPAKKRAVDPSKAERNKSIDALIDHSKWVRGIIGINAERWAKRHGMHVAKGECQVCKRAKYSTIPFGCGPLRGMCSPPCECGDDGDYPVTFLASVLGIT